MAPRPPVELDPPRLDMTPMIDVVFLMIVFFACIDFRVLEAKLEARLPRDVVSHGSVPPQEQLTVSVYVVAPGTPTWGGRKGAGARYELTGHRVAWQIGGRSGLDQQQAVAELTRIASDPQLRVPDVRKPGRRRQLPVIVEGWPDSRYDDMARTGDMCRAAGFADVQFGGGMGPRGG